MSPITTAYRPKALGSMPDEEVVRLAKDGDFDAIEYLLRKYRPVVLFKSRTYFLQGADRDDMVQEGMFGLFKAIRDFRIDRSCSFQTFADICITRQMITAIKGSMVQRQLPLRYSFSLQAASQDEGTSDPLESTPDNILSPVDQLVAREAAEELKALLQNILSPFEWTVLTMFVSGMSYQQIADKNSCDNKSVDNALCRVRRKMARYRQESGDDEHAQ